MGSEMCIRDSVYAVSQFILIFTLFMGITESIGYVITTHKLMVSFTMFIHAIGYIVYISALTFILDDCYKCLEMMLKPLQVLLVTEEERSERQKIENVINELKAAAPLNGKGLFHITRGTLTGMASVGITYIIILVQFKMSVTTPEQGNYTIQE